MLCMLIAPASAATVHDVMPIRDTQNYWGLMPHDDITVKVGTNVTFRTAKGFHDIAVLPTVEAYDACDVETATQWTNVDGVAQVENGSTVEDGSGMYHFTYHATTPGTYYVTCTVGGGIHCKTGQKLTLIVEEALEPTLPAESVNVMGQAIPFWTVGVGYAPVTMPLGDSLSFVSDTEGMHDVGLISDDACGAPAYACCGDTPIPFTELYSRNDYKSKDTFVWTPVAEGIYEVICSVSGHCQYGQRINVNVTAAAVDDPPSSLGTMNQFGYLLAAYSSCLLAVVLATLF